MIPADTGIFQKKMINTTLLLLQERAMWGKKKFARVVISFVCACDRKYYVASEKLSK